jgi:hypothetical protein
MDIRDKLRQINSLRRKSDLTVGSAGRSISRTEDFEIGNILAVVEKPTPFGAFFCHQKNCPANYRHGSIEISALLTKPSELLGVIAQNQTLAKIDLKKIIFFDTETTGVSGGVGMYAFLVGLGFFSDGGFTVLQFFLDDIQDERALLHEFNNLLENCELVVSYNGKSFDAPLLETRNIVHRLHNRLNQLPHLDLLHCARRLWRQALPDCALTTIEAQILEHRRLGDIPSFLIPHLYFDYLRERDARPLLPVFYHNQQDVLAMAALLVKLCNLFENPFGEAEEPVVIMSLAKVFENLFQHERAIELYNQLLQNQIATNLRREALMRLAFGYKRMGNWPRAAQAWQRYLSSEPFHPLPYIELAKYYEHRQQRLDQAKQLVEKALTEVQIIEGLGRKTDWLVYKEDLEYRRKRLIRKLHARRPSPARAPLLDISCE